ncbi:MAG: DNA-binding protein [Pseudobdellovibrionaceae bacterium]
MGKAKTSKKRKAFSIEDLQPVKLKAGVKTSPHDPNKNLRDPEFIKAAIFEALWDGDIEAMKEIIKAHYEAVDLQETLDRVDLKKRTFYEALSKKGNPRVETLSKILSGLKAG